MKEKILFKLVITTILSVISFSLLASGFRLPESSITGMSLSNAVVADSTQPGALIYNPALMSVNKERRLVNFGFINISLDAEVTPENGNPAESKGESNVQLPSFFYMSRVSDQWSWGLGLHVPFGLEINWPDNTFSAFSLAGAQENFIEPEHSKIEVINLTPNVSYKIDPHNNLAFGINYYIVKELIFNTQAVQIEADGEDFGYTLAYFYNRDAWNFGATYRSAVETHVEGDINAAGLNGKAEADIEFPKMLQIGIRNRINNQWAIEFDIERTYWSSFDTVRIEHTHPVVPGPIDSANNWNNVNAYRLGVTFQLNKKTQLFFGYTRDETPQPDNSFSARIPDADRQLFSAGFSHTIRKDWAIEGGIMLVKFEDRTINQPAGSFATNLGSGNTESNGTDAYNGNYKSEAFLIGFGINKTFAR